METIKIDKKYNSVILIYDYEDLITVSTEFLNDKMDYLGQISYEKVVGCSCKIHYNRPALPSDVPRLGPSMPGRFATTSGNITDVNYVRTNLAVKGE